MEKLEYYENPDPIDDGNSPHKGQILWVILTERPIYDKIQKVMCQGETDGLESILFMESKSDPKEKGVCPKACLFKSYKAAREFLRLPTWLEFEREILHQG